MNDLIKQKADGLTKLFPRAEPILIIIKLLDDQGNRILPILLEITGANASKDKEKLILSTSNGNGKVKEITFLLKDIFDLYTPEHFLSLNN